MMKPTARLDLSREAFSNLVDGGVATAPALHGGDWKGFLDRRGTLPLDFSANLSPLGMPQTVKEAVAASIESCGRYPDPQSRDLKDAIGHRLHVPPSWVFPGAGAADLIYRCVYALRPNHALTLAPSFSEYKRALMAAKCATASYRLRSWLPSAQPHRTGCVQKWGSSSTTRSSTRLTNPSTSLFFASPTIRPA